MTNDLQSDIALMERISHQDETAFHQVYIEYGQRLYAYALRLTNDPLQAEDVVQDTLVTVWKSARSYHGSSRLLTWLLGIVHHTAIKSTRHISIPITEEMETNLPEDTISPEEQVQVNEGVRQMQQCLRRLSTEHRAVLDLVFYHGMSLNEVAEICECPIGTVKSRLSYARSNLKGMLASMEDIL